MRRADRLFQLVGHLRAKGFATGQQLADELGVSKRTVYRDIRDLESSGVPIRGEAGVGYQLERGAELPPVSLTEAEIEALVLGARIVRAWSDDELANAAGTAINKVEAVLPDALRRVLNSTPLFAPDWGRRPEMVVRLPLLRQAIGARRKLRFGYRRADGAASVRIVRPLGLYFWGAKWTVACWCEVRGDYRSFRPDRMSALEMLPDTFELTEQVSLQGYLTHVSNEDSHDHASPPQRAAG